MLLALLLGAAARAGAAGDVPVGDYIRLHVVAEDDTEAAQALKLAVRDAVLERARALLAGCGGAEDAWRMLGDSLDSIETAARSRARAEGYGGTVAVRAGVFAFPDRMYGDVLVPAGDYRALRVVIGAGEGRNWWCVLYPSLCLPEGVDPAAPVAFRSALLDWLGGLVGGAR